MNNQAPKVEQSATARDQPLRLLIVDDSVDDIDLLVDALRRQGFNLVYAAVDNPTAMRSELDRQDWDVITSDHLMPHFNAPAALALAKELCPDVPFIIVSGEIDSSLAVALLKDGAQDYVQKRELIRLGPVIERGLRDAKLNRERKYAETKLRESEELFRAIVENVGDLVALLDTDGRRIYNSPSYRPLFREADIEVGSMSFAEIHPEDRERIKAIFRRTVATGVGERAEFRFVLKDGTIRHIESEGRAIRDANGDVSKVIVVSRDITERTRAQERSARQLKQLESAMLGTVKAVSAMLDMRDPYTAGHERRVGALARAIGAELGLAGDRLKGLEIIGLVHDIGKIAVPAEILSKPGKLAAVEYELIKSHVKAGCDILANIDFPWPLAETIVQHHERLDGSGYPHGLKGEAILLEACIMGVADVVEAMGSHRPYRAGLGTDMALEEIAKNSGKLYDPQVVEACLRLFREKGYTLAA